jgi:hypothetical protein
VVNYRFWDNVMVGVIMTAAGVSAIGERIYPGTTSVTIPGDATGALFVLQAAGGSSKGRAGVDGSAGGGGAYAVLDRAILVGEQGTTLTVAVGAGSAGNDGGSTTLSGTLNGSAVSVTCNGGTKGTNLVDGSGGSASGGDTNITGESGSGFVASPPGEEAPGTPGRGGCFDQPTGWAYDFGGPGSGGIASVADEPGADGFIEIFWRIS